MNLRLLLALVLAASGLSVGTASAALTFTSGTRLVTALATYAAGDGDVTTGSELVAFDAATAGMGPGGTHSAHASQSSLLPDVTGPVMSGTGEADSLIIANGTDGYSTTGDSYLDVFFTVDVAGMYEFDAEVDWVGDDPQFSFGGNHAFVELRDITNSVTLAFIQRDTILTGVQGVSTTLALAPLTSYRITANARVSGSGGLAALVGAEGNWTFTLAAVVPEAGSVAMMTLAAVSAAYGAWAGRGRVRSPH
jgi:hypothetical protein